MKLELGTRVRSTPILHDQRQIGGNLRDRIWDDLWHVLVMGRPIVRVGPAWPSALLDLGAPVACAVDLGRQIQLRLSFDGILSSKVENSFWLYFWISLQPPRDVGIEKLP